MFYGDARIKIQHTVRPCLDKLVMEIQNLPDPDDILGEALIKLDEADQLLAEYEYIHDQASVDDDGA